ncbi:hypothetical protein [Streptomyces sp. NPDC048623]|uniref:telomere-associated protein Tap n=1 Tax=Streptomyces sp. NPDC048623 TaxID=3155761 RepID=UPI0034373C7F
MTSLSPVPQPAAGHRSSYERFLAALEAAGSRPRPRGADGIDACCPVHDDTSASLSADWKPPTADKSGRMLAKCHADANCSYDDILAALDLTRADMFDGPSPGFTARRTSSPRRVPVPRQTTAAQTEESTTATVRPVRKPKAPKPEADHEHDYAHERTHTYRDAEGQVVAIIRRRRCTFDGCRDKTFTTAYPGRKKPADGLPLYGTEGLAATIAEGRTIHICEGEGDRETLVDAGKFAVSAPFGADQGSGDKWLKRHTEQLRGARAVVIWADRDPAGLTHAGYIANELLAADVLAPAPEDGGQLDVPLRIVYPAVASEKADASDHFAAGYTVADVVDVPAEDLESTGLQGLATAPPAKPEPKTAEPPAPAADEDQADAPAAPPAPAAVGQSKNGRPIEGSLGWRFSTTVEPRGRMWRSSGRGENLSWDTVLRWAPRTDERLIVLGDDGKPCGKRFTVTVGDDTSEVAVVELRTGEAWDKFPDAVGSSTKPVREALWNCVETQALSLPHTPVVNHTGWYDLPDMGRTYVFADGRTYPESRPIRVMDVPTPLKEAAKDIGGTATDEEMRGAVRDISEHGWAGLLGVVVGARSLGYTLRPVAASLVIDAEPNSGKTCMANNGRSLVFTPPLPKAWPPVPTAGMGGSITRIELAVNIEGDSPLLLDDVPLTLKSSAKEVRDMEEKLERIIRSAGNATEIRPRATRDLKARPGSYVRAIPVIAAQMLPPTMQESLYRRAVVVYLSTEGGEVDWRWYGQKDEDGVTNGARLAVPLRRIGDRIIAHLHGLEDPDAYLADLEAKAMKALAPHTDEALKDASGAMDGVVTAAAGILSGCGLVAAVTGLEMTDLLEVLVEPLTASLVRQARRMDDQATVTDDLGSAVVDIVRMALANNRAHTRDARGTVCPAVPGEIEQVQGVVPGREPGTWEGKGPAFYWLPKPPKVNEPAVGVNSVQLHTLLAASTDPRVQGISARSLPDDLLQAGLTIRSTQKGRAGAHNIRIGSGAQRVLLIKAERLWPGSTDPGPDDSVADGTEGEGGPSGGPQGDDTPPPTPEVPSTTGPETDGPDMLFDSAAGTAGAPDDQAPAGPVAAPDETTANSHQEEDDMATYTQPPTAPCIRCGNPTSYRDETGQPVHQEIPGFIRCGQLLDPVTPAVPAPAPAEQQPAPAPVPAAAPTSSPRRVTASGPEAPRRRHQVPAAVTDQEHPNGPVAVLDVTADGQVLAHVAGGRTLDVPARSIPTLVTWVLQEAGLGQAALHKWGTEADPVVVLTPAASAKYGLPDSLEDRSGLRLPETHKVVKAIKKAGWSLTQRGFGPWARIYKPVENGRRRCVQIGVMAWDALGDVFGWRLEPDADPRTVLAILGTYAQRVMAPRGTMASTGIELMLAYRPLTRPVKVTEKDPETGEVTESWVSGPVEGSLTRPRQPAPCEAPDEHPLVHALYGGNRPADAAMREEAWNWHRDPVGAECDLPFCIGIDTNTSFLSGASRLLVGDSDPVHVIRPPFDPKVPGAWLVDFSRAHLDLARKLGPDEVNPLDPRLPSPFTPNGEPPAGPRWYSTQTCAYARRIGVAVEPLEAWIREPLAAGWLDPWNERLAVAYKTTMAALGVTDDMTPEQFLDAMAEIGTGDPAERAVLSAIKQTVKNGIGKLNSTPNYIRGYEAGQPWSELEKVWWRPDIRSSVISTARTIQHSKMVKTLKLTGRAPLAAYSDCALYAAKTDSPLEIIPRTADGQQVKGAFRLGVAPGWVKLEGVRSMDWYTEMHGTKKWNPAKYIAPRKGEFADDGE